MAMNDEQLIDFVRANVKTRPVQVADKFDIELEDARNRLDALVEAGDLSVSDGFSPNGIACKVYNVIDSERKQCQKAFPSVSEMPPQAFVTHLRPPPAVLQGNLTKVQRALDYLMDKGEATIEDMRTIMDLDRHMSPTSYLGAALRNGQIIKEGNKYRLGDGKPTGRNASRQARNQGSATSSVAVAEVPPVTAPKTSALRIGIWSDGVIELQRDGKTVACILQDESQALMEFLRTAKIPSVA